MDSLISIVIAALALVISALTAWFSLFHRGTIRMTQPTIIFFGPDGVSGPPKLFLRTLLFSTARKGQIVENMYVKLHRGESVQNFNSWVYGDNKESLARGSGLFVGREGIASNHHFLLPKDGTTYEFLQGKYVIKVFALLLGRKSPDLLFVQALTLSAGFATELNKEKSGVYFDWGPDSRSYHAHLDQNPNKRIGVFLKKGVLE
ncbi:MAG: hypothetical protein HYZ89_06155 [Candidatus Omnitrophica bacterium]|nr:hypothetical protein [Candidatus Omnitrophota bacterium]